MLALSSFSILAVQWLNLRAKLAPIILMSGTPESQSWYNQPWAHISMHHLFPLLFCFIFFFISSGLGLQRLEAGLWFPGQRLRLGHSSDRILATKPVVSNKALGFQLCIKRIPTEMESSETNKVLIRRKKRVQYIWTDTQTDSERVPKSCPHGSLNHFYGAFLLVFLW